MDRIDVMRLFVRIVERGSFAQASRDLQVPRPTATHAIQRLEADLGVRLLERTTRNVRPTLDGALYHERCIRLLADLDEVESVFRNAEPKGPLRVDMQGTIARFFVMPALPEFITRYPGISLSLSEGDRMVDLITEGVDCVVRAGELSDSSLIGRRITAFEQLTLANPAYLERHGVPSTPDDLGGHRMVAYTASATGQPYPLEFEMDGAAREIPLPYDIVVRGAEIYTASGVAGLGLIQVPRYRVEHQIAAGQLVPVLETFPPPPIPVSVLYPQSRHLSSRIRVFIDWLADVFRAPRGAAGSSSQKGSVEMPN
ncbi:MULTISPECIES: LysR family transcriptional regulator [unclassified Mesorhizobium]|uniref:LysR family transcriptional regulator n=1 Tax=unclassified Mesorhizobium TaxID=325217 RepID=UPI00112D5741|nr:MULTISPECIES: LysR family transcriptional regulator [unclassified Mesorhizobium]MCA0002484.1 LysR family transcriptional regulator [Mesorhizobium sp. B264B2A]MCA0008394.1 LysR family transcriptional regulator [Mesorhizobium sp. B264B1B]MCA0016969.1 LysR family transcriptional regulator [Mesorhizobium sp. B264B1A]TPJ40178.1 LysR family transcriptional regulator [Mesorhizobium sp. B2-6-6]